MKLPLWVYDYKEKKYKVFPYGILKTLPNGKLGITDDGNYLTGPEAAVLTEYAHLFKRSDFKNKDAGNLFGVCTRWTLKEQPPVKKGPRWYSKDKHHIRSYQK